MVINGIFFYSKSVCYPVDNQIATLHQIDFGCLITGLLSPTGYKMKL